MKNMNKLSLLVLLVALAACNASTVKTSSEDEEEIPVERSGVDVLAGQAWHLENTGQNSFAGSNGIAGNDFNIKEVIDMGFTGRGVKIAVSDSGVDLTNPDLDDNALSDYQEDNEATPDVDESLLLIGYHRDYSSSVSSEWQDSASNPYPVELDGHGTAVTGLINAEGWNSIGSRGVAPGAKFAGFYFLGDFGDTLASYEAKVIDQIFGNFDIFNYSYGFLGCSFVPIEDTVIDGYKQAVLNLRGGKGAIYVKAAGNDYVGYNSDCYGDGDTSNYLGNTNTGEDQNVPYVIVTGALNARGQISSYSTPGSGLWISSAGGEYGESSGSPIAWGNRSLQFRGPAMITTDIVGCDAGLSESSSTQSSFNRGANELNSNCDYTSIMNGTSSAAPVLSGIIALMLEANPNLSWRDVKHILLKSADKINYSTASYSHPNGFDLSGHAYDFNYVVNSAGNSFSNTYGFGKVDAEAAVVMALAYVSDLGNYEETMNPNTDGWYYSSGVVNVAIPQEVPAGAVSSITVRHNYNIEAVQIRFSTDHSYIGDLGVELISPSGTRSKILLINSGIKDNSLTDFKMISNAFYGETSRGTWTINVIDGVNDADFGNIISWDIKINGHKINTSSDTTAPNAATALVHASTNASLTDSPAVTFTASTSTDVMRYEVAISTTTSGQEKAQWFSIGLSTSFTVTGMTLENQLYYIKVRAIDTSENVSSVTTSSWTAEAGP